MPMQSSTDDANSEPQNVDTSNEQTDESDVDVKAATTEGNANEGTANAINTASPDGSIEAVSNNNNKLPDDASTEPRIGLDGKAKDGSMPYALLEKQLQFLK